MRNKVIAVLLAVLTALGGLNLFQSIKNRLQPNEQVAVQAESDRGEHRYVIRSSGDGEMRAEAIRVQIDAEEINRSVRESMATVNVERTVREALKGLESVAAVHASEAGATEVMIDETFRVKSGQNLKIDVSHSDIAIRTGSGSEATIRVKIDARNMARAREVFDDMNFRTNQSGDTVSLLADERRGNWNWRSTGGMDIDVEIEVPRNFNLDIETTHGDIDLLESLEGNVDIRTSHGDFEGRSIRGERISIYTSHGDIEADQLEAAEVKLRTSHSEIELQGVTSNRFEARTSHSDVEIASVSGDTKIETSHGDIRVNLRDGRDARFTTSHGDVEIMTSADVAADLDLRAANVRVSSEYKLQGLVKKEQVDARINGGGSRISARTTHGNVTIRPR